jgi:hypothetical protein
VFIPISAAYLINNRKASAYWSGQGPGGEEGPVLLAKRVPATNVRPGSYWDNVRVFGLRMAHVPVFGQDREMGNHPNTATTVD